MKKIYSYCFLIIILIAIGCKKDKPEEVTKNNEAKKDFDLLSLADGQTDADVVPTLSWEESTYATNAPVLYDLFLQTDTGAMTLIEKDLDKTSFTFRTRLQTNTSYKWRVEAKDGKGNTTQSKSIFSFTTRGYLNPSIITANATSLGRNGHTAVVFKDKIWVIGGEFISGGGPQGKIKLNDVWSSEDGITWQNATASAAFNAREHHSSIVFDNKIWVIGGRNEYPEKEAYADVWYSEDGKIWMQATVLPFAGRYAHTSLVYGNKMWLIGGLDNENKPTNDVWYSDNGKLWIQATDHAAFSPHSFAVSVVFKDKMWLIGGEDKTGTGSVWNSENGRDWIVANSDAPFGRRRGHSVTVFDNKLWLLGGSVAINSTSTTYLPQNDIWYSEDGITWTQFPSQASFLSREFHCSVSFKNKLWGLMGWDSKKSFNDVWFID